MIDKQTLFSTVDELSASDLEELYQHIRQRRQIVAFHTATGTHPAVAVATTHEPAETIRDEVNALIDEAIAQVRGKRDVQDTAQTQTAMSGH